MRKLLSAVLLLLVMLLVSKVPVYASSAQAYQDFQYQFDLYRTSLSNYVTARNQYKQFNTLESSQDTLDKVKVYIAQRNQVAKAYFLFLNEKISEDPGLISTDLNLYRGLITNQVGFLDQNTAAPIGSLDDATKTSTAFIKNYLPMQMGYRQIIVGLELGYLSFFATKFDAAAATAQNLITASHGYASPEKQATLDRWLIALSNKHSLYQEQDKAIRKAMTSIKGDIQEQDRQLASVQKLIVSARQNLVEGTSYLGEVETALQYE